jgi:RNase P subunit RPR2
MIQADFDEEWEVLSNEFLNGMKEWRLQHPKATLREMETVLDKRMAQLRAKVLQDIALASKQADISQVPREERPVCPQCGIPLGPRGQHPRRLRTNGQAEIELKRSYAVCPKCKTGFFPPG